MMIVRQSIVRFAVAAVVAALTWPVGSLQAQETLGFYGFAGWVNGPEEYDVERNVEYGGSVLVGGGFRYTLTEFLALRGDVSWIGNSGDETGAVNQPVDFNRVYYTAKLELSLPAASGFSPYVFAGGGLVSLDRSANDYSYGISETAFAAGAGVRYEVAPQMSVFAEGVGSLYPRTTVGGNQFDKAAYAGLSYTLR